MTAANDIEEATEPAAEDRRLYSRVRFPKVRVQAPGPEGWQDEFLQDLSVGGVFLVTPRTLPVGGEISLRLLVPDSDRPMDIRAVVTRIEQGARDADSGIALAFGELSDEQRERLASLVERFGQEPTVTVYDETTGEIALGPVEELLLDVDELGRRWVAAKDDIAAARAAIADHEQSLRRNQESLEELLRRLQRALHHLPRAALEAGEGLGRAPEAPEPSAEEERLRVSLEGVREDLAAERQRTRELGREVDDLKESLQSLESPESDRDRRIQMLTAELLQAKEQAHRHEAEAAEARLALAELRSQSDLTSGDHLPPPSLAALRNASADDEIEVDFAIESDSSGSSQTPDATAESEPETGADAEPIPDQTLAMKAPLEDMPTQHEIPVVPESSFADVAAEVRSEQPEEPEGDSPPAVEDDDQEPEGARLAESDEETLGPDVIDTVEGFEARLAAGARIRLTERFGRLEPVSRGDIQVSDWLRDNDRLRAAGMNAADMSDEQLLRVLHVFFQRELIRLTA